MKAAGSGTAFEVPLYRVLAREVPERVLTPIAWDVERAWLLLPDGGPSLGEREAGVDALIEALVEYGRLQRALEPAVGEMLALGVLDMRPAVMMERFNEAVAAAGGHPEVEAMEPTVAGWCERLASSARSRRASRCCPPSATRAPTSSTTRSPPSSRWRSRTAGASARRSASRWARSPRTSRATTARSRITRRICHKVRGSCEVLGRSVTHPRRSPCVPLQSSSSPVSSPCSP
jgi:hypothetical protein